MRAPGARGLAAADPLSPKAHVFVRCERAGGFEPGPGEDDQALKLVGIELLHRVQKIAVDCHYATSSGANKRTVFR